MAPRQWTDHGPVHYKNTVAWFSIPLGLLIAIGLIALATSGRTSPSQMLVFSGQIYANWQLPDGSNGLTNSEVRGTPTQVDPIWGPTVTRTQVEMNGYVIKDCRGEGAAPNLWVPGSFYASVVCQRVHLG